MEAGRLSRGQRRADARQLTPGIAQARSRRGLWWRSAGRAGRPSTQMARRIARRRGRPRTQRRHHGAAASLKVLREVHAGRHDLRRRDDRACRRRSAIIRCGTSRCGFFRAPSGLGQGLGYALGVKLAAPAAAGGHDDRRRDASCTIRVVPADLRRRRLHTMPLLILGVQQFQIRLDAVFP